MRRFVGRTVTGLLMAGVLLAGCGNGGSAVETRSRDAEPVSLASVESTAPIEVAPTETLKAPAKAATVLTGNRRETASDKAIRLFERNGADFGAKDPEDFLRKVEAFTKSPPPDAEIVQRPNGDVLIYQASSNTFAVLDRKGVVRTMFKPSSGQDYWQNQKALIR